MEKEVPGNREVSPLDTLLPAPRHDSTHWRDLLCLPLVGMAKIAATNQWDAPLGPQTWLVWGSWDGQGVVYRFATPTDCLLWYRWCVLGVADEMEARTDADDTAEYDREWILLADDMRSVLDNVAPGTRATDLLSELEEDAVFLYGDFQLHGWESVHTYLSRNTSPAFWRETIGAVPVRQAGQWLLSPDAWQRLDAWFAFYAVRPA